MSNPGAARLNARWPFISIPAQAIAQNPRPGYGTIQTEGSYLRRRKVTYIKPDMSIS